MKNLTLGFKLKLTKILLPAIAMLALINSQSAIAWDIYVIQGTGLATLNGKPAKVGDKFQGSDVLATGANTKVKLLEGRSVMVVGENTQVSAETKKLGKINLVATDKDTNPQIFLKSGKLRFQIDKSEAPKYRFRIPSVVAGVRGTEFFMSAAKDKEVLCVLEGEVGAKIISNNQEAKVEKGIGWIREGNKEGILIKTTEQQRAEWVAATDLTSEGGAQ